MKMNFNWFWGFWRYMSQRANNVVYVFGIYIYMLMELGLLWRNGFFGKVTCTRFRAPTLVPEEDEDLAIYPTYSYIHIRRHELYWHIYLSRLTCRLACNFVSETLKKKYALVACYPSYQWVFWPFWRGWMLCVAVNNIRLIWAAHVRVIERLQMAPLGVGVSSVFTIYVPPTLLSPRRRRQHAPVFW